MPFFDSATTLAEAVGSVLTQSLESLELILVDDGADRPSRDLAQRLAATDPRVHLIQRPHGGVGAARNSGAAVARGTYLAFCDADDTVPPGAYGRMVHALAETGSDLVVGSLTLQENGKHEQPAWLRQSNGTHRKGVTLDSAPEVIANHYLGCRVFRRDFWEEQGLGFPTDTDFPDIVTTTRAMLVATSIDVVPAPVYRWHERPDERSLLQRAGRDPRRAVDRVNRARTAGALLVASGTEAAQHVFFSSVLHTIVTDLVRAAVTQGDDYWTALTLELRRLTDQIPPPVWRQVPFEDRVIAWLCAHGHREATEEFLEYAYDNRTGYPSELVDGVPHVRLPMIDQLWDASEDLVTVAESELRYRTRLSALRWRSPGVLEIAGIAFVEYLSASVEDRTTRVVLVDRTTGQEIALETEPAPDVNGNRWAARAHEDHSRSAFRAHVDVRTLSAPTENRRAYAVIVEHSVLGRTWRDGFHTRFLEGSPGFLEPTVFDDLTVTPGWQRFSGLRLLMRRQEALQPAASSPEPAVSVQEITADGGKCLLSGHAASEVELALHGPRARTPWVPVQLGEGQFAATLDLSHDEWGLGTVPLPTDRYLVRCRTVDGSEQSVACDPALWRRLPQVVDVADLCIHAEATLAGDLQIRVAPKEVEALSPYHRRRLRDVDYPRAREEPLLDTVLFQTFGGRAGGDNPGAICRELVARGEGLDLAFIVDDRSVVVPDGARKVVALSEEHFELLGRARYLVVNANLPYFFHKREGQVYLQTWHGSPLKRIAHDRIRMSFPNWHHRRQLVRAQQQWDYLLGQSDFCGDTLARAFRYDGRVLNLGYPRNDILSSPDADKVRSLTRNHLGIPDGARAVLYAPTFRENQRVGRVFEKVLYLDPDQVARDLDCIVLLRGHYSSIKAAEEIDPDRRVIDVTRYPDIADLFLAADAMVTDYSSAFFDFATVDKPMFFLAPDLAEYRDENRGFYLDYHSTVPGPVCETTEEIIEALRQPDRYAARRAEFRAEFVPLDDGHAAARVVDVLLQEHPYR